MQSMYTTTQSEKQGLSLVDIIDFKWLMAAAGHPVHVERMQGDPAYAEGCLKQAECGGDAALKQAARRLRAALAKQRNG